MEANPGQTYATASVSYESMETPDHGNGVLQFDFDGVNDVSPQFLGADVEGMGWSIGLARDLSNGWRIGGALRGAEADGDTSAEYTVPNGTPYRFGLLDGTQVGSGGYGGPGTIQQTLSVDHEALFGSISFGRNFGGFRADAIAAFGNEETEYANVQDDITFDELHVTNTAFDVNAIELSGRVATSFPISASFSLALAGSLGASFKDVDMDANTIRDLGAPVASSLSVSDEDTAAIASVSGSLGWAFGSST